MFILKNSEYELNLIKNNTLSLLLTNVLKDSDTRYICGEKELMISCNNKYETSFLFLKDNNSYSMDVYIDSIILRTNDKTEKNYFKNVIIKSIVQVEKELFVVIAYDWIFNIDEDIKTEFYNFVTNFPENVPIPRNDYKKYKKYFYIFGSKLIGDQLNYKILTVDNDGILMYKKLSAINTSPAIYRGGENV